MQYLPQIHETYFIKREGHEFAHREFEYILARDACARIIIDANDPMRATLAGFHRTDYVSPFDTKCDCSFEKDVISGCMSVSDYNKWELDIREYSRNFFERSRELRCFDDIIEDGVDKKSFWRERGFWFELPLRARE